MNIIKKIAKWVLKDDLRIANTRITTLQNDLREKDEKINEIQCQLNNWIFKSKINQNSILPQSAVKSIIDCLPNPNEAAIGKLRSVRKFDTYFSYNVGGKNIKHLVRLEKFCCVNEVIYAQVKIYDLNISIKLPLKKEKIQYNAFGVNTEIETYYWGFNFSNIKIVSDDVWKIMTEFITAQKEVLTEL